MFNSTALPSVVSHESVHATASEQLNDQLTTPHYKTRQALSLRLRRLSLWLSQDSKLLRQSMGIGLSRRDALDICLACIMTSCAIIAGNMVHEPLHRAARTPRRSLPWQSAPAVLLLSLLILHSPTPAHRRTWGFFHAPSHVF